MGCPERDRPSWLIQEREAVQIPHFSEVNHPLIKSLSGSSDGDLLAWFQRYRERGRYFTALFCRYGPLTYTLVWHSTRSPVQADYLFALTWRHFYQQMQGLDVDKFAETGSTSLQSWLINQTGVCLQKIEVPPATSINYDLKSASPPLWCYLEIAVDRLPPHLRLMLLMSETFHWSETRIAAYLQAEKEMISPAEVRAAIGQAYQQVEAALPEDIREIYLNQAKTLASARQSST